MPKNCDGIQSCVCLRGESRNICLKFSFAAKAAMLLRKPQSDKISRSKGGTGLSDREFSRNEHLHQSQPWSAPAKRSGDGLFERIKPLNKPQRHGGTRQKGSSGFGALCDSVARGFTRAIVCRRQSGVAPEWHLVKETDVFYWAFCSFLSQSTRLGKKGLWDCSTNRRISQKLDTEGFGNHLMQYVDSVSFTPYLSAIRVALRLPPQSISPLRCDGAPISARVMFDGLVSISKNGLNVRS